MRGLMATMTTIVTYSSHESGIQLKPLEFVLPEDPKHSKKSPSDAPTACSLAPTVTSQEPVLEWVGVLRGVNTPKDGTTPTFNAVVY